MLGIMQFWPSPGTLNGYIEKKIGLTELIKNVVPPLSVIALIKYSEDR